MFSPLPSRLRQNATFRIAVWHAAIYVVSLIGLFLVINSTLSRLLRERDLQIVSNELRAVGEEYGEKGVPEVASYVEEGHSSPLNLVRVADANNKTLFASRLTPARIIAELEKNAVKAQQKRTILRTPGVDDFDVETATLPNGIVLQAGLSTRPRMLFLSRFRRLCAVFMLPTIIFAIFGGMLFAERTLRPIRDLAHTTRRILHTGKLDERIALKRAPGDLLEIVRSFNAMLGRIEALIGSIRDSVDNVAHELRTPMTRLRGMAETALRDSQNIALAQSALGNCVEECDHVMSLLDVLMDLAEAEAGVMKIRTQPIDLPPLVRRIADLYELVADSKGLKISVMLPAGLTVSADPNRLPQALANLVDNAVKYTPCGGDITITGWRQNGEIAVSVKDTGIGISPMESDKVWERLYRADKSRSEHGLGLGLTVVKAIVEAHHGRVTLDSQPNYGSVFTLYFPAV
jgi:signal transduction histidine kinase